MGDTRAFEAMSEPRQAILMVLKRDGASTIADLATQVGITYEAIRQHMAQLELDGWIARRLTRGATGPGRPKTRFQLTTAGEHLFPKEYDELAVALIDAASERLGPTAVAALLEEVARKKVEAWQPKLIGKSLDQRLEALRGIYSEDDPYCRVERDDDGSPKIVEMNCPFLQVARRRPALCSVTVSVLGRLLGRRVVRTERFQDGDGRCVFKVLPEVRGEEEPLLQLEPSGS